MEGVDSGSGSGQFWPGKCIGCIEGIPSFLVGVFSQGVLDFYLDMALGNNILILVFLLVLSLLGGF